VCEANKTREDEKLQLELRWGYAEQGIRAMLRLEARDERPIGMRTWFPRKTPRTAIVLLLGLGSGCALEIFFLGQLLALGKMRLLLL
jgi:hypothetical protein